ncbi:MAG: hypothetical protein WBM32_18535 [Crocosphaera sp.]|jgi:hypothetical protein
MKTEKEYNQSISLNIKEKAIQERLFQARWSFILALVCLGISFSLALWLLLSNQVSEAIIISISGLASSVGCLKFAKETNDRLDKIISD